MKALFGIAATLTLALLPLVLPAADEPNAATPWIAFGRVTDVAGRPVAGARISAHCGIGTLMPTGNALSDSNGMYELRFAPGVLSSIKDMVQAATISVQHSGFFETNLHRQGGLIAAMQLPERPIRWGNKTTNDLFLPGAPRRVDFVLAPAATIKGMVLNASGKPLVDARVGLTGDVLPPACSVLAEHRTDREGRFQFGNVPTGYEFRLYVEDGGKDWREWPGFKVKLSGPSTREYRLKVVGDRLEEAK